MKKNMIRIMVAGLTVATAMWAQNFPRQATMVGGGSPDQGKCTVEVVVDDVAQVEIRGTSATLRTLSGQQAQWRRFECSGALPASPGNFRFSGVDGRGRQTLVRDPRNGGVAVVQIEDKDNGAEGYTFDIMWDGRGGGGYPQQGGGQPGYRENDRGGDNRGYRDGEYRPNYHDSDYYRRYQHGFSVEEAARICQQAVFNQASRRFHSQDIHFHGTTVDDGQGRGDWIVGTVDVHRGGSRREERYRFSCSVDFGNGRVRSADLDRRPLDDDDRWHR